MGVLITPVFNLKKMAKKNDLPFPEVEVKNMVLFEENITKKEIEKKSVDIIESVNEGHVNSIEVFTQVRAVKELTDMILSGIKDKVVDDLEMLNPLERTSRGVKIDLMNGRNKYDFSDDGEWCTLQMQLEIIKDKIKAREKLMIKAIEYSEVSDLDGVVVSPARIVGGTEKVVKITIPK